MALTHFRAQVRQMVSVQDFYKGILFEQARKALYSTRLAPLPKELLGSTDGVCSEAPLHLTGEVFQLFSLATRLAPLPKEFLGSTDGVCSEVPPHLTGEVFSCSRQ
jgi:hypothetical protein